MWGGREKKHHNKQPGRLIAIFMLCQCSTSTNKVKISPNWTVGNIAHHEWHVVYSNTHILLRTSGGVDPLGQHTMLIFSRWIDTASSETSVVMRIKNKTTIFKTIVCWFTDTHTFFPPTTVWLQCKLDSASWQSANLTAYTYSIWNWIKHEFIWNEGES